MGSWGWKITFYWLLWGFAKLSGHFLMELELNMTGIWLTGIVIIFSALGRITDLDSDDWIINSHQLHSIMNPKLEVFGSQCVRRRCAKLSSFDQDQHWSSSKDNTKTETENVWVMKNSWFKQNKFWPIYAYLEGVNIS